MRKPRDFDLEMKALNDRAKLLKERKVHQLGELVIACGADVLPIDALAGAVLSAVDSKDAATVEGWRKRGAAFFQSTSRNSARRNRSDARGGAAGNGGAKPAAGDTSAQ
ncbi:MAG: conjugal transfer protein TraD [Sphingomonas sp.]